jgi:hypothetical protein
MAKKTSKVKKAAGSSKPKRPAKKPKSAKRERRSGGPNFGSADAVFEHLGSTPRRVTLTGALQKLNDEHHVAFTSNGNDWLALPVSSIDDAKVISHAASETAGLDCISVVVCLPPTVSNAALDQMSRHSEFSELKVAPPSSPPPICPGGIARWVGDHWECT